MEQNHCIPIFCGWGEGGLCDHVPNFVNYLLMSSCQLKNIKAIIILSLWAHDYILTDSIVLTLNFLQVSLSYIKMNNTQVSVK